MAARTSRKILKARFIQSGFCLLLIVAALLCGTSATFAGGSAGTITSPGMEHSSGTCQQIANSNPDGVYAQACGVGFTKHSVDDTSTYPYQTITSKEAKECKSVGASEIYVLAMHRIKPNSTRTGVIFLGKFGLGVQVGQISSTKSPYIASHGALQFNEVEKDYQTALAHALAQPEDFKKFLATPWEKLTYFCWDQTWDATTSSFDSWSFVDDMSTADSGPDSEVTKELTTTEEEVTVTFKHQFSYNKPTAPEDSIFDPASTNWSVDVTEDGNRVGGYGQQQFKLSNSGPNRNSVWDDMPYLGETTYTVQMPEGVASKTVCSKITYAPKTIVWDENPAKQYKVNYNESGGGEDSEACIVITKDPTQTQVGDYASTTTVNIPAQGDDIHGYQLTSEEDGKDNNVIISTDQADVDVEFWHEVIWHGNICPPAQIDHEHDTCDQHASTPFTITTETRSQSGSGTHSGATGEEGRETISVHLEKGETKKVCRRITYTQKHVPFESYKKTHGSGLNAYTHTHYKIVNPNGTDYSEACATITHPADPDIPGPGKIQGPSSGSNDATPMYAGEDATISWETSAPTYDVRRLMQWQAISFQVPVFTVYNNELSLGNIGKDERRTLWQDPCEWYNLTRRTRYRGCEVSASSRSDDNPQYGQGSEHAYQWSDGQFVNKTAEVSGNQAILRDVFKAGPFGENIVVPNLVGDKHCNSFGFQFQYYYAYVKNGSAEWHKDTTNRPYWVVYDAACRAIAKKPSIATWNGGLFSGNGGVTTSIANRFDNTALNTLTTLGGPRNSFGSWSEYLATINGGVEGYTSGTVLSWHGVPTPFDITANSPLTIANGSSIGNSLIAPNSILYNRLQDYLFSQNESYNHKYSGNQVSSRMTDVNLGSNMSGTTIVSIDGKLTIDRDIKINTSSQSSIYTLPQVVVYAKDGIDITNDVKQIDAWLVTDGELNTCRNDGNELFIKDVTEARVNGWSRNVNCDNELVINGPVFAKKVTLNRTYGADGFSNNDRDLAEGDSRAATGEIFNLSADSYLWAWVQSGRYASSYSEAYSRELPPRY